MNTQEEIILSYLNSAYCGARMNDDESCMRRTANAISAFKSECEDSIESVYIVVEDCAIDYQEYSRIRFVSFSENEAEEFATNINNKRGLKYAASVIELDVGENFVSL